MSEKIKDDLKNYILIVFPDEWPYYSPTILNLAKSHQERGEKVVLLSFKNGNYKKGKRVFNYHFEIPWPIFLQKILRKLKFLSWMKFFCLMIGLFFIKLRFKSFKRIYGIDSIGHLSAKSIFNNVYFLSLELIDDFWFKRSVAKGRCKSLIIQTNERANFFLEKIQEDFLPEVSLLPNSPLIHGEMKESSSRRVKKIIFMGNIHPYHGAREIIQCISTLSENKDYQFHFQGLIDRQFKKDLEKIYRGKKLIFHFDYIEQSEVLYFLRDFDLGLCFYSLPDEMKRDFNYLSCPSGKLYNYFAAGLPILGSEILGLRPVNEHKAGVLLSDLNPKSIKEGIELIDKNYQFYAKNSLKAGRYYDFKLWFDRIQ